MSKKILKATAFISAAVILLSGCGASEEDENSAISVVRYSRNDLSNKLQLEGTVEGKQKDSAITTELTEYKVKSVNFKVGERVKAGDIVCEFDSSELENDIAELEKTISDEDTLYSYKYQQLLKNLENTKKSGDIKLNEAQKSIDDAKASYENYKSTYENNLTNYNNAKNNVQRIKEMLEQCSDSDEVELIKAEYEMAVQQESNLMQACETSKSFMESALNSISILENSYETTKVNVDSDISNVQYEIDTYSLSASSSSSNSKKLAELKNNLEKTVIRAESDGIISNVFAEEGKVCRDGVIMTVQSSDDLLIHVVVKEEDFLSVKEDMNVDITITAKSHEVFSGKVDRILEIKGTDGFDAYISIDDTECFRIGMTAKAKIAIVDEKDVLSVNKSALFREDEKVYVYEAEKQSDDIFKLRKVEVTEGITTNSLSEIKGEGLDEGDFIVSFPANCSDGQIVNVIVADSKAGEFDE